MQPGHYQRLLALSVALPFLTLAAQWLWGLSPSPLLLGLANYLVRPLLTMVLVFASLVGWLFLTHHPGRMMGEPERAVLSEKAARLFNWLFWLAVALVAGQAVGVVPNRVGLLAGLLVLSPLGALPVTLIVTLGVARGILAGLYTVVLCALLTPFAASFIVVVYPVVLAILVTFVGAVLPAPEGHPLGGRRVHGLCLSMVAVMVLVGSNPLLSAGAAAQCRMDREHVFLALPRLPAPKDVPEGYVLTSGQPEARYRDYFLRCGRHPGVGEDYCFERLR